MASVVVKLKMLTPLWTGGADGNMDRVHETGILGSLRWWYEAIVRGLGGYACDPTEHECQFDAERYKQSKAEDERQRLREAGLCDACQVFGATGFRRRFSLSIVRDHTKPMWDGGRTLNVRPPGRTRGWFLPPGRMGTLELGLEGKEEKIWLLAALFLFLEKWGALGAKTQLGYGVFALENRSEVAELAKRWPCETFKDNREDRQRQWPNLRRFDFIRCSFTPKFAAWWTRVPGLERLASQLQPLVREHGTVPVTPGLRNEWRFNRFRGSRWEEAEVFGALRPERVGSKIGTSWAYKVGGRWEVRAWVWLANDKWASRVRNIVTDKTAWDKVLGSAAELDRPLQHQPPWSAEDVVGLLKAAMGGSQ